MVMDLDNLLGVFYSLLLAGLLLALMYSYLTRNFTVFKKTGIPGPTPYPLLGNILDMTGMCLIDLDLALCKKYGKFVGTFVGATPVLLVYDGEWIPEAFIKHFQVFTNRNNVKFGGAIDASLFSVTDNHWRHSRKTLTPVFTSFKLKQMVPSMQKCCQAFVRVLESTDGKPIDVKKHANLLTLDVISMTAFGLESNVQENPKGQFAMNAYLITNSSEVNSTFKERLRLGLAVCLTLILPARLVAIVNKVFNLGILSPSASGYLESLVELELNNREKNAEGCDLLQTLRDNMVDESSDSQHTLVDESGEQWTESGLTRREVIGNSILFLFAGFQTTAESMTFVFYELAHHPLIQEMLYKEITDVCDTEAISVDQVNNLKYLDYCINETLRLYPQGFRFDRVATQDIVIQGIQVVKGTVVTASPWLIHRDPEIWVNPLDFDPERFSPERFTARCSAAYIPFGLGNRKCIGSRLALLEIKIAVICTLKAFKVEKNSLTPNRPIKLKKTMPLAPLDTEQPMMISFIRRNI